MTIKKLRKKVVVVATATLLLMLVTAPLSAQVPDQTGSQAPTDRNSAGGTFIPPFEGLSQVTPDIDCLAAAGRQRAAASTCVKHTVNCTELEKAVKQAAENKCALVCMTGRVCTPETDKCKLDDTGTTVKFDSSRRNAAETCEGETDGDGNPTPDLCSVTAKATCKCECVAIRK